MRRVPPLARVLAGALAAVMALTASAAAGTLTLQNTSRPLKKDWWSWTVFLAGPPDEIRRVDCVEYHLHPTFAQPVQKTCSPGDPRQAFALSAEGWGVFDVKAFVRLKGSKEPLALTHRLRFEPLLATGNTSREARSGWWDWTVFLTAPDAVLDQVQCVRYTLHSTVNDPVREVCRRGCGLQAFALRASGWGTFDVGVEARMKDGSALRMRHPLSFGTRPPAAVSELRVPQLSFARLDIPGSSEATFVYVSGVEDSWRTRPFALHVVQPGAGWPDQGALEEAKFLARIAAVPRHKRWTTRMGCEGPALEFAASGKRYVLEVKRVTTAPGQKDSVTLTIVPQ